MKYGKLISKLTKRSNNNGYVAVALVAGLAAGALLSILFAPESGEDTRRVIRDKAKGLGDNARDKFNALKNKFNGYDFEEHDDDVAPEVPHFVNKVPKKRKSDIKDIVHEAHVESQNTEQSIS
ncbi:YtxH domain-containing protein [Pedobacter cryotolerans]|uniref:YtxH domain-containing protein n=1 Tax=Pedobacter cryotolerans TaxID=2571270 RepID=A0A4U1BZ52_9SPHI|nr:YtxH domain-containing protein [Pedobacter cryotolerans]TKB98050.1 YtxH domain-containing protein [Pedobacter cryotolerans]